jgi:hypothetical protein
VGDSQNIAEQSGTKRKKKKCQEKKTGAEDEEH